jgi:hypothetical protein
MTAQADPDPQVDGAEVLDTVLQALTRYVALPSPEASDAVVLWIAATHVQPAWAHAPRLVIRAPERRCGKSRLLDVVEATCFAPLITVNASTAAVFRAIGTDEPPTLLVDEADTIFGGKNAEANEDLRGLLNAGHQRNRPAIRWDINTRSLERLPTFAMAALAGIGAMPDTIEDRAVVVRMRRRAPGETVAPYRVRRDGPKLHALAEALHDWLRPNMPALEDAEPDMPVEDRAADTWEPLVAIADLAGSHWPDSARQATLALNADNDDPATASHRTRILADCRTAFGNQDAIPTTVLLDRLKADDEAPWASYGPNGLTSAKLGALLREYDIRSGNIRFDRADLDQWGIRTDSDQLKGYRRADFLDAWSRYCPADAPRGNEASQPSHLSSTTDGLPLWDGTSRPRQPVPGMTSNGTPGTPGTATPSQPVCIQCRTPLSYDDGSHTHPNCATA